MYFGWKIDVSDKLSGKLMQRRRGRCHLSSSYVQKMVLVQNFLDPLKYSATMSLSSKRSRRKSRKVKIYYILDKNWHQRKSGRK